MSDRTERDQDNDEKHGHPEATTAGGDDERESRERIEQTGEPERDALGNQDGAS